ncbi:alkaline phosphatase D [Sporothrix brasiliensis 5110]|uniref:Alkaline phosphatase D n=1 Tax=Sporothrix brasiliensis 5110 TaxID=1398154 RepID=A0A0C2F7P7_9PEZI|nr:alkaline phosphatase D [Sporothrix brasiliensis 5110]KIH95039.1 alkaline phosphatase D [Sporothrix brasiliensis 5110]
MAVQTKITTATSVLIPIYIPSFVLSYLAQPQAEIIKEMQVLLAEKAVVDDDNNEERIEEEVVDITSSTSIQPRPLNGLRTLLLGVPSPSKLLSFLAVLTNTILVALVADRLYSEHAITADDLSFVRLGYVSDTEAKFLIREPDQAKMPVSIDLRMRDAQPPFDNPLWQTAGGARWTDNSTDYTVVVNVKIPHPGQRVYEWRTSNNHSGEFVSGLKAGVAPALHDGNFTFVATSCMISRVPYTPLDHPLAIPGTRHLARVLPSLGAQFMLFLGDFVYVDTPRWWGKSVSDYRQKYRQVYASPDWNPIAQNLSWIHVLDDHEIANDWDKRETGIYHAAVDPYHHYHTAANPPLARQAGAGGLLRGARAGATYFEFSQGPASFFMLDTRSYRSSNSMPFDSANKTMLGADQLADFLAFLRRPEPRGIKWKIVASSVPFTKNWRINTRDTWGGFLVERQIILEAMWDAGLQGVGVVILSGDRHEFAATQFPPPAPNASDPAAPPARWPASVAVHEFSASPLSQFYSPVPSYFQWGSEDVKIAYIYRGNSKFGAITILPPSASTDRGDAAAGSHSRLQYRLFVNGKEAWNTILETPEALEGSKSRPKSFWSKLLG